MTIAKTIKEDLDLMGIRYSLVSHPHSNTSIRSANSAHIPIDRLAKGVVLKDEEGYVLAVLPATHNVDLKLLEDRMGRRLELETEYAISELFPDCEPGAIPANGVGYGLDTIVDTDLLSHPDIYFEAGNHEELVHIQEIEFEKLMVGSRYDSFSMPAEM